MILDLKFINNFQGQGIPKGLNITTFQEKVLRRFNLTTIITKQVIHNMYYAQIASDGKEPVFYSKIED